MLFFPKMYRKNIYDINYSKLYDLGIRCIVFDLDNTLAMMNQSIADKDMKKFFKKIKEKFKVFVVSNNVNKSRVATFAESIDCDYFYFSTKPSRRKLRKIKHKFGFKNEEICVVGDQLMTDIFMANRFKAYSCLVEPLAPKELKITSISRFIENKVLNNYQKKGIFKKGEYYE